MEPTQNQNLIPASPVSPPVMETPPTWQVILTKIKPILVTIFNKFYSNKKVFWLVSIAFGLIFLILILGLLFGKKGPAKTISNQPTPTPFVLSTPVASSSADIITVTEAKLNTLKNQIDSLDVKQSRLQPPTLNFNVKF